MSAFRYRMLLANGGRKVSLEYSQLGALMADVASIVDRRMAENIECIDLETGKQWEYEI